MIEPLVNDGKLPSSYYTFLYDRTHKPQNMGHREDVKALNGFLEILNNQIY
jgi:hypothetical protein